MERPECCVDRSILREILLETRSRSLLPQLDAPFLEIFDDVELIKKIQAKLPYLFFLAELDASRAGKIGMEIGSVRERIIIALMMQKFGANNVKTNVPITETEIDVIVKGHPLSIKTISGPRIGGVKAIWTVDAQKAKQFVAGYNPRFDILLVQVNWGSAGVFAYIPLKVQQEIFRALGRDKYFSLPKEGTNPRGVEFSRDAMMRLSSHPDIKKLPIHWTRPTEQYDQYQRWLDYWSEN